MCWAGGRGPSPAPQGMGDSEEGAAFDRRRGPAEDGAKGPGRGEKRDMGSPWRRVKEDILLWHLPDKGRAFAGVEKGLAQERGRCQG